MPIQKTADQRHRVNLRVVLVAVRCREEEQRMPRLKVVCIQPERFLKPLSGLRVMAAVSEQVDQAGVEKGVVWFLVGEAEKVLLAHGGRLKHRAIKHDASGNSKIF